NSCLGNQCVEKALAVECSMAVVESEGGERFSDVIDGAQVAGESVTDDRGEVSGVQCRGCQVADRAGRCCYREPVDYLPVVAIQRSPVGDHAGDRQSDSAG